MDFFFSNNRLVIEKKINAQAYSDQDDHYFSFLRFVQSFLEVIKCVISKRNSIKSLSSINITKDYFK